MLVARKALADESHVVADEEPAGGEQPAAACNDGLGGNGEARCRERVDCSGGFETKLVANMNGMLTCATAISRARAVFLT